MPRRAVIMLLTASTVAVVAACSSSSGSNDVSGRADTPVTGAQLATTIRHALARVTSVDVAFHIVAYGQVTAGTSDQLLSAGRPRAYRNKVVLPGGQGTYQLISTHGKAFVRLPPALRLTGKTYSRISPDSSNPLVRSYAANLQSMLEEGSISNVTASLAAARSVRDEGRTTHRGVPASKFAVTVDLVKITHNPSIAAGGGRRYIPLVLYVDLRGRPLEFSERYRIRGQFASSVAVYSEYNRPLTIEAPPATLVGS